MGPNATAAGGGAGSQWPPAPPSLQRENHVGLPTLAPCLPPRRAIRELRPSYSGRQTLPRPPHGRCFTRFSLTGSFLAGESEKNILAASLPRCASRPHAQL